MTSWLTLDDLQHMDQRDYDRLLDAYIKLQGEVVELRRRLAEHEDHMTPKAADFHGMTGTRRSTFLED